MEVQATNQRTTLKFVPINSERLCAKCSDALPRCCEPWLSERALYGNRSDDEDDVSWLIGKESLLSASHIGRPNWVWPFNELTESANRCGFCRFLQQVLLSDPVISKEGFQQDDQVLLQSKFVGSIHQQSQYNRCYRPKLQVFRKYKHNSTVEKDSGWLHGSTYTMIFPLAQPTGNWEETIEPEIFYGRPAGAEANLALIQHWLYLCRTKHSRSGSTEQSRPSRGSRSLGIPSAFASASPSTHSFAFLGSSSHMPGRTCITTVEQHFCQPERPCSVPNFRLINIKTRCVVYAKRGDEYAALSYVWGPAKRLILCHTTWTRLTTPNGLSDNHVDIPQTFRDAMKVAEILGIPFLWVDALCIRQDCEKELTSHMNLMDAIYVSATLTIVSNTNSVDTGIPGISCPRKDSQIIYKARDVEFISTKRTFAQALIGSPWETRGWTLQEKVFSRRLLIFTESQAFYHCSSATYYEDTIFEPKDELDRSIYLAERSSPFSKSRTRPEALVYRDHRPIFPQNFWDLVEVYSQRQLSFDKDALYAFSGILRSIRLKYGPDVWGVPQRLFSSGMTWNHSKHWTTLRRTQFPSWSWAGWNGNSDRSKLGHYLLTVVREDETSANPRYEYANAHNSYGLPNHPGGSEYTTDLMKPLEYLPDIMPPISHILRFWTSATLLLIDPEPSSDPWTLPNYTVRDSYDQTVVTRISLDKEWRNNHQGLGEFIVISEGFYPPSDALDEDEEPCPVPLHVMLIERANGLAYRVQMCQQMVDVDTWRSTRPQWKLINLA